MRKLSLALAAILIMAGCGNNQVTKEASETVMAGDTITVNGNSHVLDHIITQKVQLTDHSSEFRATGTVRPVSGRLAEIAPPLAGRIIKSHVRLGQKVGTGTPLFDLGSADFFEAAKTYFAAQSASDLARRTYERQKELAERGVTAQRDLELAQSEAEIAARELEQAKASLAIYNINPATLEMGQPLRVVSPIAGEVVKTNMTIGSYVAEDSDPLVIVADLSHVWVTALVNERYLGTISNGDRAEVYTIAGSDNPVAGTIHYVGEIVNEETRSIEVIIECGNSDRTLKPGMFCEVRFFNAPAKSILLPATAIMKEQDHDFVLIELARGKFVRRTVEIATAGKDNVLITKGLKEGDNVVTGGGIYLNF